MTTLAAENLAEHARSVRERLPPHGMFAGMDWRISPIPYVISAEVARELETLGRVLLQFNRAVNLLYQQSFAGKEPSWVAQWLDQGKPAELLSLARNRAFRGELPRVIRPDILLTDSGFSITELDSVPGGIGLTAWLNETYAGLARDAHRAPTATNQQLSGRTAPAFCAFEPGWNVVGGAEGMLQGFGGIFGDAARVHIVVSQEAATYLPEMEWLAARLGHNRFRVQDAHFSNIRDGEAVYRFFELFDLANVPNAQTIFELAARGQLQVTPPPKPFFEEKMLLGLLWNRHLREFWRRALGEAFFTRLLDHIPYTWVVDGAPLPPQGVIPELNLSSWDQLKLLSQRQRDLILKLSGYSEHAWGARSVVLGSDVSATDWSAAVDRALSGFARTPYVLQRYHKPRLIEALWYDFGRGNVEKMVGRVRLCPYYFVVGSGDGARATLGGVLATICPADKKIIHGMRDAILAPCAT